MTLQAVIFDIGNVLIEWQPERYYDRIIGPDRRRAMFAEVDLHAMNDRVDRGADFRATIYDMAEAHPDWRAEIRAWHDHWLELACPVIPHSVRLMRALQAKRVPVFALTNFGVDSFALAKTAYDFLADFDRAYVSGHMQVIKPEARIYQMVEQECGLDPAALLFTDDRTDNIAVAAARGWQTHHFTGPEGWADRLVAAGLLTPDEAA
ncbi:MAG: HAD family phosphatase [Rhodobacterales bacterium]|nr:HAD family phosphatase [Rhodobacterales bacterium]